MKNQSILNTILENIYYTSPLIIVVLVVIITGIYLFFYDRINKKMNGKFGLILCDIAVVGYITVILLITLLLREEQVNKTFSLILFECTDVMDKIRGNMMNILLFYPLGILIGTRWNRKRMILIGLFLSLGIEISQFMWNLGYAEIDDVINNTIGTALGTGVMIMFKKKYVINCNRKKVDISNIRL